MEKRISIICFIVVFIHYFHVGECRSLRLGRAVSYIANQTVCVVDGVIFRDGDGIPTDDPCESCKCRPPGFSCVLRECEVKPGCKAIRREGECCPEYQCGCEHNGKFFNDGDRIPNAESPCYSCYCQGSSITCALADCKFRFDCEPEYVPGECCPRYDHCPPEPTRAPTTTMSTTYSPAPVFIPSTTTTSTTTTSTTTTLATTVIPPVEVVPTTVTSTEVVNDADITSHKQTTEIPVTSSGTKDISVPVTTIENRITFDDEVTTKKPFEVAEVKPVSDERREDPIEKVDVTPVKVDDTIASGVIEVITTTTESNVVVEDNFPTTKLWIPDTSLSAEHKDSNDQNVIPELVTQTSLSPTTISGEALNKEVNENTIKGSEELLNSTTTALPSSSSSESIEEVSLTTISDNMTIM